MDAWKMIAAFGAVAGFMVSVMVYRTNEMDERIRLVEQGLVRLEARHKVERILRICAEKPEVCDEK